MLPSWMAATPFSSMALTHDLMYKSCKLLLTALLPHTLIRTVTHSSPICRKDAAKLDGSDPLLLNGYGSYEISNDPYFSSNRLCLLDRGWVFAMAHIRGGGEMGRYW